MAEHNFVMDYRLIPDNLKCVKCQSVLREAQLLPCGCRICRNCLDDMLKERCEFCPGDLDDCKEASLLTATRDDSVDLSVSKLTVICSHENCLFRCELANLGEHLLVCPKRRVKCPFYELGCQQMFAADQMSEHFLSDKCNYTRIFIDMNSSVKIQLAEMRARNENIKVEIDVMRRQLELKDEKIETLIQQTKLAENAYKSTMAEMASIKIQNEYLTDKLGKLSSKIDTENVERRKTNDQISEKIIDYIKKRLALISKFVGFNETEFELQNNAARQHVSMIAFPSNTNFNNPNSSLKDGIKSINEDLKLIESNIYNIKSQIQSIEGVVQIDGSCIWRIDKDVRKTHWDWKDREIEYFYGTVHPYRYRLASWDYDTKNVNSLDIHLRIYQSDKDTDLVWPFRGSVTISITDKAKADSFQRVTKKCEIKRPEAKGYSYSDDFVFPHAALVAAGIDLIGGVRVSCAIIVDSTRRYGLYSWLMGR